MDRDLKLAGFTGLAVSIYFLLTHQGGVPLSYDFGGHLSRIYILLQDGVGWTDLWYNGYDLFHFYPPLYYLAMAPIAAVSMDLVRPLSFALLGGLGFYSMYFYSSRKLEPWRARIASLLFMTGWLLYVVHVSGSMPQAFSAALAPLFFGLLEEALEGKSAVPAGIVASCMVLLHHNSAIAAALGAVLIILLNLDKNYLNAAVSGLLAAGVSAFWLVPAGLEFGNASYGRFHDLAGYGVEGIIMVMPLFAVVISVKALASLDSFMKYRQEAVIGLAGVLLSFGWFTAFTGYIPVVNRLPPYRIYLLSAVSFSFLAAASRKKLAYSVMIFCVAISMFSMTSYDDRGLLPGQKEAYDYVGEEQEGLVYDSASTDMKAYGLTIHEKRIADGWSVGSTPIRFGLAYLGNQSEKANVEAAEFLRNWSVDYVLTYERTSRQKNLGKAIYDSQLYIEEKCFEQICVHESNHSFNPVAEKEGGSYLVNASQTLPIPYSRHFNSSVKPTELGFSSMDGEGWKRLEYQRKLSHKVSLLFTLAAILASIIVYRYSLVVPERYSKDYLAKMIDYVRDSRRRES